MSVEEMKALERRYYEAMNKKDLKVISELTASDIVLHGSLDEIRGLEELIKYIEGVLKAFPDAHFTIDDIIVEGDKVAFRWTFTGTHKGEFKGMPPTNKKVTVWGIEIDRVVGGKIVETWARADTLGMMQQLGLIPAPK